MYSLDIDLQQKKTSLAEFQVLADRILYYLPNVLSSYEKKGNYRIYTSNIAGTTKYLRPINEKLFVFDPEDFKVRFSEFLQIMRRIRGNDRTFSTEERQIIDQVVYTIQQSIGAGLDLLVNPNSARKHVGNRFE